MLKQHTQVVCGNAMTALVGTRERRRGLVQQVLAGEENRELERSVGVATLVGALICSNGAGDVTALLKDYAEVVGGGGVSAPIGARKRILGFGQLVPAGRQNRELERPVGVATLVCTPVGRLCASYVAAGFQENTKLGRGRRVASLIGPRESFFRFGQPGLLCEPHRELEVALAVAAFDGLVGRSQRIAHWASPVLLVIVNLDLANPIAPTLRPRAGRILLLGAGGLPSSPLINLPSSPSACRAPSRTALTHATAPTHAPIYSCEVPIRMTIPSNLDPP